MCDINAFLVKDGKEELILENVDQISTEGDELKLLNIFGEELNVKARLQFFDNTGKRMILKAV